jgi:hypothetical protein
MADDSDNSELCDPNVPWWPATTSRKSKPKPAPVDSDVNISSSSATSSTSPNMQIQKLATPNVRMQKLATSRWAAAQALTDAAKKTPREPTGEVVRPPWRIERTAKAGEDCLLSTVLVTAADGYGEPQRWRVRLPILGTAIRRRHSGMS